MSLLGGYPLSSNPISGLPTQTAAGSPLVLWRWDNPTLQIRAQQPAAFNNLLPSLLPTGLQPFPSTGGPYPQFPRALQVDAFQSLLSTLLGVTAAYPFVQTNWPNPQTRVTAQAQSFNNYLPAGGQPLGQWLFANPQTIQRIIQTDTFENLLNTLLAQTQAPLGQWAWANPTTRAITDPSLTFTGQNLQGTLLNPVQTMPFAQLNWPNPMQPVRSEHLAPFPPNNTPIIPTPTPPPPDAGQSFQGAGKWDVASQPGLEELHAEHRRLFREKQEIKARLELFEARQEELRQEHDRARKVKKQARTKREAEALAYRQAMAAVLQSIDRLNVDLDGYADQMIQLDMLLAQAEATIAARIEFERQNMNALALLLLS